VRLSPARVFSLSRFQRELNFPAKLVSRVRRHSRRRVSAGREGEVGFSYFLDLADREERIIHFQADGWKLAVEPLVFFRRAAGQLALMDRTTPPPIESIAKTGMTGTSKAGSRRSHGAGRRSHGAEPHFEPSMQAI
jgi:hypothetical protein